MPLRSAIHFILLAICQMTFGNEVNTLIETSLLVQIDKSVEESQRRYSSNYQPFGGEASVSLEYDNHISAPNQDLLSSLSSIYDTLDENSLFDAFDHSLSYSIDLKNNGSYGGDNSENVLKDNLYIAINACVRRAEALNIDADNTFTNISDRIVGNFLVNPKGILSWGDSALDWLEDLSHIFITSSLNSSVIYDDLGIVTSASRSFTDSVLNLYNLDPATNNYASSKIYPGIEEVTNNPSQANQIMLFGGDTEGYFKFDPLKTQILSSSSMGLVKASTEKALISSNIDLVRSESLVENTLDSIGKSFFNFINENDGDHSLFAAELSKAFAIGSSRAIVTSAEELADKSEAFTTESFIEFATSQLGKSAITNSLTSPNISLPKIAEAIATGTALGVQFPTIIANQSLDDKFAGLNRDLYAQYSSKGIAKGTIRSVSVNIDRFTANSNLPSDLLISEIASHTAKGSVYGNTTLAIYNPPPKELLSIINNSARGAAEGSTNVLELNNIDKSQEATEDVVVQIARASSHGSTLAATFGLAVLDEARPDTLSYDRKTIAAVESASYGAAYGAISGAIKNGVPDTVVIKQASKQGSIEGALIGAGLGTKHDEAFFNAEDKSFIDSELKSKKNIIKVVEDSSSNAALSANSSRATKTIRTNSKNMIMLMRKFNISPRTTNPTRIFQKRKSTTNFESDFPIKDKFRAASPI